MMTETQGWILLVMLGLILIGGLFMLMLLDKAIDAFLAVRNEIRSQNKSWLLSAIGQRLFGRAVEAAEAQVKPDSLAASRAATMQAEACDLCHQRVTSGSWCDVGGRPHL